MKGVYCTLIKLEASDNSIASDVINFDFRALFVS